MPRKPTGRKPTEGQRVAFNIWLDGHDDDVRYGYVISLLSSQFTIQGDDGGVYYQFYSDHGVSWREAKDDE